MQAVGSAGPAAALIVLASVRDANSAVVLLSVSMALSCFAFAGFGSNHLDIAPRHAGILYGLSNTVATLPGIIGVGRKYSTCKDAVTKRNGGSVPISRPSFR